MSLIKIKFGKKEVNKKEFYSSKQAISLDSVDLNKIVVSKKWEINDTTYKHICGYLNNDTIIHHYVLFYLKWMDILNILLMVEKICHLLQMMGKFIKSIMKYGT